MRYITKGYCSGRNAENTPKESYLSFVKFNTNLQNTLPLNINYIVGIYVAFMYDMIYSNIKITVYTVYIYYMVQCIWHIV